MPDYDMCVPCGLGLINIRAGAIILKDGCFLMAGNDKEDYLYSVGGRIRFGETAEEAVIREVLEETGILMEVDRLGFIHENYFIADEPGRRGKTVYETAFYFYMKVPEDLTFTCESVSEYGAKEYLQWVPFDTEKTLYPEFFRTELREPSQTVKHIVTDDRYRIGSVVTVTVDRPLGSRHPQYPDTVYPVNYGYVKDVMAPDGEEQDAYILGVDTPVETFTGILAAVLHREDDAEDKWVVIPEGTVFSEEDIRIQTGFQEKYFKTVIKM